MKAVLLVVFISAFSFFLSPLNAQIPQGFNYQAIARDGSGNPIVNATINVRLSILTDTGGFYATGAGNYVWEETHTGVKTNAYGLFTVIMGNPLAVKFQGSASSFSAINWASGPLFIGTKIQNGGPTFKIMGSAQLWTVPYAMAANSLLGTVNKLNVTGTDTSMSSALFEVKNNNGQTIFAVYNEGVRVYVDDGVKGLKGGFAIGSFGTGKAPSQEFFRVTKDSTRVYVNQPVKGQKGGFAIGSFSGVKASTGNFLDLTSKNYFIGQDAGKSITTGLYNTFIGYQNGFSTTKGSQNTFLGYKAGYMNDTASFNVFIGNEAGYNNIRGTYNTFMGYQAGQMNTTGSANIYIGQQAGYKMTTGLSNVFIGPLSGLNKTAGSRNLFMGTMSGSNSTTGNDNIFLGTVAGLKNSADFNVFIGNYSGFTNTTGANNIFAGPFSGAYNRKGSSNIYIGLTAGYADTTGNWNIFMGEGAGYSNMGSNNIIMGYQAGYLSTTGDYNIIFGNQAGAHNSGINNLFFGWQSGYTNTTGSGNVFMGPLSGGYSNGDDNTYIGNQAGYSSTTGSRNIAIGTQSGYNLSGISNIFLGYQAGYATTSGMQNTFLGLQSGYTNTTGYNNVFIGVVAGQYNTTGAANVFIGTSTGYKNTTGLYNTSIGNLAGANNQTGSSNVFVGNMAGMNETGSNRLYISNTSGDKNNALVYGEFDTKNLTVNGNVGVGKTNPLTRLDVLGGNWNITGSSEGDFRIGDLNYRLKIGVATAGGGAGDVRVNAMGGLSRILFGGNGVDVLIVNSSSVIPSGDNTIPLGASGSRWSTIYAANGVINTSDSRLKSNITELDYGLESIMKLSPVSFTWKDDKQNLKRLGLIAQDVEKVISEVVDKGNDPQQTMGINYSELVPVLIKGMQEQQKQIESQKEENTQLRSELQSLKDKLNQIETMLVKSSLK